MELCDTRFPGKPCACLDCNREENICIGKGQDPCITCLGHPVPEYCDLSDYFETEATQ
jgi:hypothetical protein